MVISSRSGGVVPARVKGVAPPDAFRGAPEAGADAVRAHGVDGILGTRGSEPAGVRRQEGGDHDLVRAEERNDSGSHVCSFSIVAHSVLHIRAISSRILAASGTPAGTPGLPR